ncbi:hypothetical protein [Cobetia marina]|uniref:hypothetical protein n=1 Tax=Cobetia marina TaxID=28258 RepID=UPI002546BA91|nr:hypothetical protein [Cobetia pacifica]MDI6003630.1 hypothetical protein [Cobetia pacifica]
MFIFINYPEEDIVIDNDIRRVIEYALDAHANGKHIVWMSKKFITVYMEKDFYEKTDYYLKILYSLRDTSREIFRIKNELTFYLEINLGEKNSLYITDKHMKIGYEKMLDSAYWQPFDIVVENLTDADLLKLSAQCILIEKEYNRRFSINIASQQGGGSTTLNTFENCLNKRPIVLCILDNDKSHPKDDLGNTASRFKDYPSGPNKYYYLKILKNREIENIIPYKVYEELAIERKIAISDNFSRLHTHGYRQYFDHKNGLKKDHALEKDKKLGELYWDKFTKSTACGEWICRGFGDNIAKTCYDHMNNKTKQKIKELVDTNQDKEWLELGRLFASWGICSSIKIR